MTKDVSDSDRVERAMKVLLVILDDLYVKVVADVEPLSAEVDGLIAAICGLAKSD